MSRHSVTQPIYSLGTRADGSSAVWKLLPFHSARLVRICDESVEYLAFMVDGSPQVLSFTFDFHEDLAKVPPPATRLHPVDPAFSDLRAEHRSKTMPPIPDRFVADVDAEFIQQIHDVPERQGEANVQHYRQADDVRAAVKAL